MRKILLVLTLLASTISQGQNTRFGTNALVSATSSTSADKNSAFGDGSMFFTNSGLHNSAFGNRALYNNTAGGFNSAFGSTVLYNNIGYYNSAFGYQAMYNNTSGISATAMGFQSLLSNTTGWNNTAFGRESLRSNTTGSRSVAIGGEALYNSNANELVAIGYQSLYSNTTGSYNTAIGHKSLFSNTTADGNTAIGYIVLRDNTTGVYNTGVGKEALRSNISGNYNVAIGSNSLIFNTTGSNNSAVGADALMNNTSGNDNLAFGTSALLQNTIGNSNSAIGRSAMYSNTTGGNNVSIGTNAMYHNTVGNYNVANGLVALSTNRVGQQNVAIGAWADVAYDSLSNAIAIGSSTVVNASNKALIGNVNITSIGGQVGWTTFSDGRYKRNVQQNVHGLDFISKLKPVTYTVDIAGLNKYYHNTNGAQNQNATKIVYNGFIAQEVQAAADELGMEFSGVDKPQTKEGLYGLRYDNFVPALVKAIQELSKQNDELRKRVTDLESRSTPSTVPVKGSLGQNAPNPTNGSTTISYSLVPGYKSAWLTLRDMEGRLLKEYSLTSSGTVVVDTSRYAAGTYVYSLSVDNALVETRKLTIL